jgi:DNA-binding transcriptional ArsR family regulator
MRPSTIDKLEPELRGEINRLRVDKGYTIEQIVEYLKAMNATVSKSAVGRHVKKLAEVGARIREARAVAEGISPTISAGDDGHLVNMNIELLHGAIMRIQSATGDDGSDVELTANEAKAIGSAIESCARAAKLNAERVLKIRKETADKAAKAVDRTLKRAAPGLSKDTVAEIRRAVLGVAA